LSHKKDRLLFLVYHGRGHFNACFHAAKILSNHFEIYFAGVPFFQSYLVAQGFNYIPLKSLPFGTSLEHWQNEIKKRNPVYLNTIKDRWQDTLYKQRESELTSILQRIEPKVILLDAQQSTDFIALYKTLRANVVKVALLHTMLPMRLRHNVPPMNSLAWPNDDKAIKAAHRQTHWRKIRKRVVQLLKYGISDDQIVRRRIKRNRIPTQYFQQSTSSFHFTVGGVDEIVFAPLQFELPNAVVSGRRYVGTFVDHMRVESADEGFLLHRHGIFDLIREKNLKVIYCAFGSLSNQYQDKLIELVSRIIAATANQECVLLVALNIDHTLISHNNPHVYLYKQLPQIEILEHADVFINHGGLNSIKEGIDAKVPMLVFPIEEKTDTCGNSTRVVYHGIGLRGDVVHDGAEDIKQKIETLLRDNSFRENFMALTGDKKEKDEEFLSLILSLKPLSQ
jgi:zeaxanthin glucosyltransferase